VLALVLMKVHGQEVTFRGKCLSSAPRKTPSREALPLGLEVGEGDRGVLALRDRVEEMRGSPPLTRPSSPPLLRAPNWLAELCRARGSVGRGPF